MTPRPQRSEPVAAALPPRTHFDSQQWLNSRQPSRKGTWARRGGAVLVTGLLGVLGWVGYQQMPAAAAKSESPQNDDQFVLEGQTAGTPEANFAFERPKPTEPGDTAATLDSSPFDTPQAFAPRPTPVATAQQPAADPADNPFAAFAPKQTAMAPAESPLEQAPPRINSAPRRRKSEVTLTSNETPATSSVEVFEVGGQSEPATTANTAPDQSQPVQNAAEDPFAAFAPSQAAAAEAPSTVPAQRGARTQTEVVTADAAWAAATPQTVTPIQLNSEPAQFPGTPQFEAEAKPIGTANSFAAETAPPLNRTPAAADWPPHDQQPAVIEPRTPARRITPRPVFAPAAEPAQTTGFNVPQPAAPANDPRDEKLHVVQQGETYWSIARQHYGAGRYFQALAEYNKPRISDQSSLKPGMKVLVPSATTLDARYGKSMQASGLAKPPAKPQSGLRVDPQGRPLYVVGEGDTLGEIARRYLGKTNRMDEISRLNQEQLPNPNKLKEGMILLLPNDAAEVQSASSIPGRR